MQTTDQGVVYYVDHVSKRTSWDPPLLSAGGSSFALAAQQDIRELAGLKRADMTWPVQYVLTFWIRTGCRCRLLLATDALLATGMWSVAIGRSEMEHLGRRFQSQAENMNS